MDADDRAGVPSIETVEYGRRVLADLIERYKRFESESRQERKHEAADRFRAVHFALVRHLYGHDDGGCVITAFDKRLLDPRFREVMGEARRG